MRFIVPISVLTAASASTDHTYQAVNKSDLNEACTYISQAIGGSESYCKVNPIKGIAVCHNLMYVDGVDGFSIASESGPQAEPVSCEYAIQFVRSLAEVQLAAIEEVASTLSEEELEELSEELESLSEEKQTDTFVEALAANGAEDEMASKPRIRGSLMKKLAVATVLAGAAGLGAYYGSPDVKIFADTQLGAARDFGLSTVNQVTDAWKDLPTMEDYSKYFQGLYEQVDTPLERQAILDSWLTEMGERKDAAVQYAGSFFKASDMTGAELERFNAYIASYEPAEGLTLEEERAAFEAYKAAFVDPESLTAKIMSFIPKGYSEAERQAILEDLAAKIPLATKESRDAWVAYGTGLTGSMSTNAQAVLDSVTTPTGRQALMDNIKALFTTPVDPSTPVDLFTHTFTDRYGRAIRLTCQTEEDCISFAAMANNEETSLEDLWNFGSKHEINAELLEQSSNEEDESEST